MKILATVLLTLLSTAMPTVLAADKKNVRGQQPRQLQTTFCGCNDCTLSVWNTAAERFDGDHTCGERITWVNHNMGVSEEDACVSVAGEFPTVCGKACHPYRCDGRQVPYEVADEEFPVQAGDLTPETELYCYPPAAQRQRWTGVWGNDFIMEAKETVNSGFVTCDPGSNYFTTDRIAFDGQELTFELARDAATGRWMGAEVRLVLPDAAFSYGAYEWSVPTIRIVDTRDGSVVPGPLPPGLVLGLFTWDSTEDFALRENRNHEVDVEISVFGDVGGPDVNFLVQPPGEPQQAKLYSGGTEGQYDQSGHSYKFDWEPGMISWYSDAAGGLSHVYSSDKIIEYYSPSYIQCLPADVEIRMNLWSLDGVNRPRGMTDNQKIEVVIDNFTYTPSAKTHVEDGGSCTKHCHCSSSSECFNGVCVSTTGGGTPTSPNPTPGPSAAPDPTEEDPSPSPTKTPAQYPVTTEEPPEPDTAVCSAYSECAHLAGDCCPTPDYVYLSCCFEGLVEPTTPATNVAPPSVDLQMCASHPVCSHLANACCPTVDNVYLSCCFEGPVEPTTPATTAAPPSVEVKMCASHPNCAHLAGDCCPTPTGAVLGCCGPIPEEVAPTTPVVTSSETCASHPDCAHLAGNCCPTRDGVFLHCCGP